MPYPVFLPDGDLSWIVLLASIFSPQHCEMVGAATFIFLWGFVLDHL